MLSIKQLLPIVVVSVICLGQVTCFSTSSIQLVSNNFKKTSTHHYYNYNKNNNNHHHEKREFSKQILYNTQSTTSTNLSPSSLSMKNQNEIDDPLSSRNNGNADPTGLKRGLVLFPLVVLIATWLFTIPPEFRRARICSEQQVIDNPGSKCITAGNWVKGVKEYYSNGGGIKFDFTIDPDD